MKFLIDLITRLPLPVQLTVIGLILGAGLVYAHETRYITVGQYTKSYVLNLKAEIRAIRAELKNNLDDASRRLLEEQLHVLLDDLCYELPNDPYCKDRK